MNETLAVSELDSLQVDDIGLHNAQSSQNVPSQCIVSISQRTIGLYSLHHPLMFGVAADQMDSRLFPSIETPAVKFSHQRLGVNLLLKWSKGKSIRMLSVRVTRT